MRRTTVLLTIVFAAVFGAAAMVSDASAIGSSDPPPRSVKKDFENGKRAIYEARYDAGIRLMAEVLKAQPDNADAHNYMGFAHRKKGDLKRAARSYRIALRIKPNHKGALEYQGEMFLKMNDLKSARANLAKLVRLCPSGCKERAELERAISDFLATRGPDQGPDKSG